MWYLICSYVGGGGGGFAGLVSLTFPYSSELFVLGGGLVCLQGFACVSVGLAHLLFYGRENKCVKM